MTGSSSEFKILNAVVVLNAVAVVDVIVWPERASKMALHNETMLKHVEAVAGKLDVSVFSNSPRNVSIAARARTEAHTAPDPLWLDCKLHPAGFASDNNRHTKPPNA